MAKINLKDLIKNKKLSSNIIDDISKSFFNSVVKDVENTIKNVKGAGVTIRDLRESDKWLGATLNTVVNAAKFNSKAKTIALQIVQDNNIGDFLESFEDTIISVKLNNTTGTGSLSDKLIETTITVTPSAVGPSGELVAQMLNVAFFGGEVKSPLTKGGENQIYTFNGSQVYNQSEIDKAADKLRDFFYKQHKDEIIGKFEKELDKVEKDYK